MFNFTNTKPPQITPDEVRAAMERHDDFILLDVRTAQECIRGRIEGSLNVNVDDVEATIESVLPDKSKKIYIYCLSGARSDAAVSIMREKGYTDAYSMTNGLLMWRMKHYPLIT